MTRREGRCVGLHAAQRSHLSGTQPRDVDLHDPGASGAVSEVTKRKTKANQKVLGLILYWYGT
jgi:hypothetical protein